MAPNSGNRILSTHSLYFMKHFRCSFMGYPPHSQNNDALIEISSCRRSRGLIGNRSDWISSRNPLVVDQFVLCIIVNFLNGFLFYRKRNAIFNYEQAEEKQRIALFICPPVVINFGQFSCWRMSPNSTPTRSNKWQINFGIIYIRLLLPHNVVWSIKLAIFHVTILKDGKFNSGQL